MLLKICVLQLNYCVGDLAGNARKIIDAASTAYAKGARLVVTPELAICGYAAEDLFLRASFIQACDDAVNQVAHALAGLKGLTVVVGTPLAAGDGLRTKSQAGTRQTFTVRTAGRSAEPRLQQLCLAAAVEIGRATFSQQRWPGSARSAHGRTLTGPSFFSFDPVSIRVSVSAYHKHPLPA